MCLSVISLADDYINGIQYVVDMRVGSNTASIRCLGVLISLIKFNHRYCKEHCFLGILIKLQKSYLV